MQTVLITLVSPEQTIDLRLPAEVPVGDLIPRLREICGARRSDDASSANLSWHLQFSSDNRPFAADRSLSEAGVVDGAIILLQPGSIREQKQEQRPSPAFQPKSIQPEERSGGIGVKWHFPGEESAHSPEPPLCRPVGPAKE